jgi:uncharacterized oxidoreductase
MHSFPHEDLRELAAAVLEGVGTPADLARIVGDSLVDANLAGHDSHGVLRLPGYCGTVSSADVIPDARATIRSQDRATAQIDGAWGWGQPAMQLATATAIDLAREFGVGAAVVHGCYHIGRVAPYVESVANAGMIGIAMSYAGPAVAPYGGKDRVLGTNPFAWAMPRGDEHPPLSFDIATAGIAEGKLRVAMAKGQDVAPGLLVNRDGIPTNDPNEFYAGGSILPFGGHKGNGFSVLAQMLGRGLTAMDPTNLAGPRGANGPVIIVIDVSAFGPLEYFVREVLAQGALITNSAPAEGFDEVLLPGDIEQRTQRDRLATGIPIPDATWAEITALANELGVTTTAG